MINFHPLTPEHWSDFEKLFGPRGACGGCWCMYWRLSRSQFEDQHGELNRRNMKALVDSGIIPGILAYAGEEPIGWCSIAPREEFPPLHVHASLSLWMTSQFGRWCASLSLGVSARRD
jgi:hypothetical protein